MNVQKYIQFIKNCKNSSTRYYLRSTLTGAVYDTALGTLKSTQHRAPHDSEVLHLDANQRFEEVELPLIGDWRLTFRVVSI